MSYTFGDMPARLPSQRGYLTAVRTFVCAKGNKLAYDLATTGQEPEPEGGYRYWELPEQYR
eukprot:SAG25_NODE_792_length_5293_cov_27.354832_7_plen_61_part_00